MVFATMKGLSILPIVALVWLPVEAMPEDTSLMGGSGELAANPLFTHHYLVCHVDYEDQCLGPCATYCTNLGKPKSNCNICQEAACDCFQVWGRECLNPDLICLLEEEVGAYREAKEWPAEIVAGKPAEIDKVNFGLDD
ncbi:unnamed protein product [Parascedosporium putredinis]|uniref:Uncharacterized protein n=1 Tax=Parascedosporium putredinis TaxID=1442378 RepID=A0A9P1MAJ5_9PEZI|nr:unnamed protein product [Parascedosporium putredinis]CAI7994079.1 unnamed protein product [Parascedosporium putredinis]